MTLKNGAVNTGGLEACVCGWQPPAVYRVLVLDEQGQIVAPLHPDRYLLEQYCPNCKAGFTLMSDSTTFDSSSASLAKEEKELDDVSLN